MHDENPFTMELAGCFFENFTDEQVTETSNGKDLLTYSLIPCMFLMTM